ncbi:MAG: type I DNA topoisomerase [Bacillota bacterium]
MADKLVIVESPAKADTIVKLLESKEYKVVASNGHVRDLPKSQLGVDTENDFAPKYITIRGRGDIIKKITKDAKNAKTVYLATDPDREGEAISWHLAQILKMDEDKACRVEFNEITGDAIKNAIAHPRTINTDLVNAQQTRRILDRLVGYKISPLLWAKVRKGLSAGRVQSVATRIIVEREQEIRDFVPQESWSITARLAHETAKKEFEAKLVGNEKGKLEIRDREQADAVLSGLKDAVYTVKSVKTGEKSKNAPPPFTTSQLQQEASRKLGFTTKRTMLVAQQLYEGVQLEGGATGLVTYIRTDSVRVANEAQKAARKYISEKYGKEYVPQKPNVFRSKKNAQDAHEAIRPTYIGLTPESIKDALTKDQFRLYRLIYNRFLASQMTSAKFETIQMDIQAENYMFRAYGETKVFAGYTIVYTISTDDDEKEVPIPLLKEGDICLCRELIPMQHFSQPPPRYTEASLVRALEDKGIGRPSTYAPTISTIIERGYVKREKKVLYPTELGEVVTKLMRDHFNEIVNTEFTADIEEQLDEIAEGHKGWTQVLKEFYGPFRQTLDKAEKEIEKVEIKDEVSDVVCEKCGSNMVYKRGRFGTFLACPNFPECRNTKAIVEQIDVPCPKCGSHLIKRRSKNGRRIFFGCEKYPDCDFVSWDPPVREKCPECGSYMVEKLVPSGGGNRKIYKCANKECGYKKDAEAGVRSKLDA